MRSFKKNQYFKKRKFDRDGNLTEKICNHCKNWKSFSGFYQDKSLMDGFSDNCSDVRIIELLNLKVLILLQIKMDSKRR